MTPISDAQVEHNPIATYALFSGGNDSLGATHYTMENHAARSVVHIRWFKHRPGGANRRESQTPSSGP